MLMKVYEREWRQMKVDEGHEMKVNELEWRYMKVDKGRWR